MNHLDNSIIPIEIIELTEKLNEHGKTFLVGGFIRDSLFKEIPNDVDFLTTIPFEVLKGIFPKISFTKVGLDFGIFKTKYKNWNIDFSVCDSSEDFISKLNARDFTINAGYFDGTTIFLPGQSLNDIKRKKLSFYEKPTTTGETQAKIILRGLRFISRFNLSVSEDVSFYINKRFNAVLDINVNIRQLEFFKIVNNDYALKSFSLIANHEVKSSFDFYVPPLDQNIQTRLLYFSYLTSSNFVENVLMKFKFSGMHPLPFKEVHSYFENPKQIKKNDFTLILSVANYVFNKEPKLIQQFLNDYLKGR
jgi:tRNA nucleotidyltransferase/poly(A) polymerase